MARVLVRRLFSLRRTLLSRTSTSIDRRQGGMAGLGKNSWPNVENGEVADLYIVLFDCTCSDPESTLHGREGFFFGANGEHTLYDVGKKIAEVLVELGIRHSSEPTTFTDEEVKRYLVRVHGHSIRDRDKLATYRDQT